MKNKESWPDLIVPVVAIIPVALVIGIVIWDVGRDRGPKPAKQTEIPWEVAGSIEIVDGKIIGASNVHIHATPGSFAEQWRSNHYNVIIQPYRVAVTGAWDSWSDTPIVYSSNGIIYETYSNQIRAVGATVRLCPGCGGAKWLKHDDYKMPSGEIVPRYATCQRCKGKGIEE